MRRWLALLLVVCCSAAPLAAQHARAQVELHSGAVLTGRVESIDDRAVVVVADGERRTVPIQQVAGIRPVVGDAEVIDLAADDDEVLLADASGSASPDERLAALLARYLWFVPMVEGHLTSFGALLLVLMALVVQFSARMANLESRGFGRCMLFSLAVALPLVIEASILPANPVPLSIAAGVNLMLWFLCALLMFRADYTGAGVLLMSFVLCSLVGVLTLEVGGLLLNAPQLL